jgi:uncharacterized protein YegP (UPF0339 family)
MSKVARGLALAAFVAGLGVAATVPLSPVQATQAKKDDKKKSGKTTGIVEVNEGKDGKFRLVIRDNDEKFLATSAAFATKAEAEKGIERIQEALENPKVTHKKSEGDKDKGKDKGE